MAHAEVDPFGHIDGLHRDDAESEVSDDDIDDDLDDESDTDPTTLCIEVLPIPSLQALDGLKLRHRADGDYSNPARAPRVDDNYCIPGVVVTIYSGEIGEKEIQIFRDQKGETSVRFWGFEEDSLGDFFDQSGEVGWSKQRMASGAGNFQYFDVLVALLGSGGAGAAIAAALGKFLVRHKHKEIEFHSDGELKLVKGYTASEFDRIMKTIKLSGELSDELYGNSNAEIENDAYEALMRKYDELMWGDADPGADDPNRGGDNV